MIRSIKAAFSPNHCPGLLVSTHTEGRPLMTDWAFSLSLAMLVDAISSKLHNEFLSVVFVFTSFKFSICSFYPFTFQLKLVFRC